MWISLFNLHLSSFKGVNYSVSVKQGLKITALEHHCPQPEDECKLYAISYKILCRGAFQAYQSKYQSTNGLAYCSGEQLDYQCKIVSSNLILFSENIGPVM